MSERITFPYIAELIKSVDKFGFEIFEREDLFYSKLMYNLNFPKPNFPSFFLFWVKILFSMGCANNFKFINR